MEKITKKFSMSAPSNEMGVVFLFGACFNDFHFSNVIMRNGYPDARAYSKAFSKNIYIEFELISSNFIQHGHIIGDVDLIICWRHDAYWLQKPVLELSSGKCYIYYGGDNIRIFDWKTEIPAIKSYIRNNSPESLHLAAG